MTLAGKRRTFATTSPNSHNEVIRFTISQVAQISCIQPELSRAVERVDVDAGAARSCCLATDIYKLPLMLELQLKDLACGMTIYDHYVLIFAKKKNGS